jgi:hypothetical protein
MWKYIGNQDEKILEKTENICLCADAPPKVDAAVRS